MLQRIVFVVWLFATGNAVADSRAVCRGGRMQCLSHVQVAPDGRIRADLVPNGFGPADLQSAYAIDPSAQKAATIAIVDAYGYANLESDLAQYRAQFGLPLCTRANGCLAIVNQQGQAAPLPPDPPPGDDWTIETALDVDMASAACPRCKILVVQGDDDMGDGLLVGNDAAAALHATTISNSWSMVEVAGSPVTVFEPHFTHPGIAIFASSGDSGFDRGGAGPEYPATSAHVIGVGGTSLFRAAGARGWAETAWNLGGSACSLSIPKPAFQTTSPCAFRASSDVSAVGDPMTGVAVFNANAGGWLILGGTSAASPIVATIFGAAGLGDATPADVAQRTSALFDVTSGSNGPCGNVLCNAGAGWDGPTGYGTPNAAALAGGSTGGTLAVQIAAPHDGATVSPGFTVDAMASANAVEVALAIDGTIVATATAPPYTFRTPLALVPGTHDLQVGAIDAANNLAVAEIHVVVSAPPPPPPDDPQSSSGCGAGDHNGWAFAVIAVGWIAARRRPRG